MIQLEEVERCKLVNETGPSNMDLPDTIALALKEHGYDPTDRNYVACPLTGGVSSDIWKVETSRGDVCVKMALPTLKVAELWQVPVERNRYEVAWFQTVKPIVPNAVPNILLHDAERGVFAMEYLPNEQNPNWKQRLLDGYIDLQFVRNLGSVLVKIHNHTAGSAELARVFATDDLFTALRPSPYFLATALKHPELEKPLLQLCDQLMKNKLALVHGDMSPKNILCGTNGPIILDAEAAWYGDPAFDLAFCLNHLLLKALHLPQHRTALISAYEELFSSYLQGITWEEPQQFVSRVMRLLPALQLARVDGKSPVEYLQSESVKQRVRDFAIPKIQHQELDWRRYGQLWLQACD